MRGDLDELARQHPEVLGERFTSTAKGKEKRFLMGIRKRYYSALLELAEVRQCVYSEPPARKALSPDVVNRVKDVTPDSVGKSH